MSEENVEIVRRYLEKGLESVSTEQLPAWLAEFWESDGDYYPVRGFPEARPCHGRKENVVWTKTRSSPIALAPLTARFGSSKGSHSSLLRGVERGGDA